MIVAPHRSSIISGVTLMPTFSALPLAMNSANSSRRDASYIHIYILYVYHCKGCICIYIMDICMYIYAYISCLLFLALLVLSRTCHRSISTSSLYRSLIYPIYIYCCQIIYIRYFLNLYMTSFWTSYAIRSTQIILKGAPYSRCDDLHLHPPSLGRSNTSESSRLWPLEASKALEMGRFELQTARLMRLGRISKNSCRYWILGAQISRLGPKGHIKMLYTLNIDLITPHPLPYPP